MHFLKHTLSQSTLRNTMKLLDANCRTVKASLCLHSLSIVVMRNTAWCTQSPYYQCGLTPTLTSDPPRPRQTIPLCITTCRNCICIKIPFSSIFSRVKILLLCIPRVCFLPLKLCRAPNSFVPISSHGTVATVLPPQQDEGFYGTIFSSQKCTLNSCNSGKV